VQAQKTIVYALQKQRKKEEGIMDIDLTPRTKRAGSLKQVVLRGASLEALWDALERVSRETGLSKPDLTLRVLSAWLKTRANSK